MLPVRRVYMSVPTATEPQSHSRIVVVAAMPACYTQHTLPAQVRACTACRTRQPGKQCLAALTTALHAFRMRQADLDCVRRFFREDLLLCFDKVLQYPQRLELSNHDVAETLLETLQYMVWVAADALVYRGSLDSADATPDLDCDLTPVVQCMLNLFNWRKPLLEVLAEEELPAMDKVFSGFADRMPNDWADPIFQQEQEDPEENEEQQEPADERHRWLVHLINLFGFFNGFNQIVHVSGAATAERTATGYSIACKQLCSCNRSSAAMHRQYAGVDGRPCSSTAILFG